MTRYIDQVPRRTYSDNSQADTERIPVVRHPATMRPLRMHPHAAAPLRRPEQYPQAEPTVAFRALDTPTQELAATSGDKKRWMRRGVVAIVATGIVGGGAYAFSQLGDNDPRENNATSVSISSEPLSTELTMTENPGELPRLLSLYDANDNSELDRNERDGMKPEDYVFLDDNTRASDRAERFTVHLESAWNTIQAFLDEDEKKVLSMPDLQKPRAEWSDQDYLNYRTLAIWLSTRQMDQDEGKRALSAILDPSTEAFENVVTWMETHPAGTGMKAVQRAIENPMNGKEFRNETVGPHVIGQDGGRLVGFDSLIDGSVNYSLFRNTSDESGNVLTSNPYNYDMLNENELHDLVKKYGS